MSEEIIKLAQKIAITQMRLTLLDYLPVETTKVIAEKVLKELGI